MSAVAAVGSVGAARLVVLLATLAARPPSYGGEVVSYVYGPELIPDPALAQSAADAAAQAAAFERLYIQTSAGLEPVLARGAPVVDERRVIVPLRRDVVMHDGEPLTPQRVIDAFERLSALTPGAYVLSPVVRRGRRPAIRADDDQFAVQFELTHPDPDFPYLLAADHARLAWDDLPGPLIGTGPFRWTSSTELRPFLEHREGRPFIDRLIWRRYASRFGAGSIAQRGRAPIFGGPEIPHPLPGPGTWLVLQVGTRPGSSKIRRRIRSHIHGALGRELIVRRYLGPDNRPAAGFIDQPIPEDSASIEGVRQLELIAPRWLRFRYRLVERLQLELFRSGLRAQVKWVDSGAALDPRHRNFDLRVLEVRAGVPDDGSLRSGLHRTLSAAAVLGVLGDIRPVDLARFAAAEDEATKTRALAAIERRVRQASGAVVIGKLVPAVALPAGVSPGPRGMVDWAHLTAEAAP